MIHSLRVFLHSSYVLCLGGDLILFICICLFLKLILLEYSCFPGGSDGKESACNAGDPVRSLRWEDPLEKGMMNHSSILAWRTFREEQDKKNS